MVIRVLFNIVGRTYICGLDHNPVDGSNQESSRELLDPMSEHSTAIWYQQVRPVEGIIVR